MVRSEQRTKMEIRSRYLNYRNSLSLNERKEKSNAIWELLKREEVFQRAQNVLVYMDYRSEVMTTGLVEELLENPNKKVFVPKVEGMDIHFYEIHTMDELKEGYQGIREPDANSVKRFNVHMAEEGLSLILVPGAVFDRAMGRMGYGKGFYDRYLASMPGLFKAALSFSCQITNHVPSAAHDIRMDMIITENGIIK